MNICFLLQRKHCIINHSGTFIQPKKSWRKTLRTYFMNPWPKNIHGWHDKNTRVWFAHLWRTCLYKRSKTMQQCLAAKDEQNYNETSQSTGTKKKMQWGQKKGKDVVQYKWCKGVIILGRVSLTIAYVQLTMKYVLFELVSIWWVIINFN